MGGRARPTELCGGINCPADFCLSCGFILKNSAYAICKALAIGFSEPRILLIRIGEYAAGNWRNHGQSRGHCFERRNPKGLSRIGMDERIAIRKDIRQAVAIRYMAEEMHASGHPALGTFF